MLILKYLFSKTYSKWYLLSFSWLTCTIWFDVTIFSGPVGGEEVCCCLGLRFKGLNFFDLLCCTTDLNSWLLLVPFDALEDDDDRFFPLRARLPLIVWTCFFELSVNVLTDVWWWLLSWTLAFLLVLWSLELSLRIMHYILVCVSSIAEN